MKKLLFTLVSALFTASLTSCMENAPKVPDDFLKVSNIVNYDTAEEAAEVPVRKVNSKLQVEVKIADWGYENLIPYTDNLLFAYDGSKYFLIDRNNIKLSANNFTKTNNVTDTIEVNSFDAIEMYKQDNCFIAYVYNSNGTKSSVIFNEKLVALYSMMNSDGLISDYKDGIVTITWDDGYMTYAQIDDADLLLSLNINNGGSTYVSPISYGKIVNINSKYVDKLISGTEINNSSWMIDVSDNKAVQESVHFAGLDIIFSKSAINKEGWIYAYLGVVAPSLDDDEYNDDKTDEAISNSDDELVNITEEQTPTAASFAISGSDSVVVPGFYNVLTGRFVQSPGIGMSEYVIEENGCNTCTVMDHFASVPVEVAENGAMVYRIFDLAKEQFVDENLYSHVQLMRNDKSIAHRTNGQVIYLDEAMLPNSIDCDNLSSFVGDFAMITYGDSSYVIDRTYDILSPPIECDSYMPAASYYEFSPSFRSGTFIIKKDGVCHLAECRYISDKTE